MTNAINRLLTPLLAVCLLTVAGCSRQQAITSTSKKTGATGSIKASPNPIQVCNGSLTGVTTLSWTAEGSTMMEVHVSSPTGDHFASSDASSQSTTGDWVSDGMVFYLQDVSNKLPLTPENTIATVTVKHTAEGCQPSAAAPAPK